jgi:hypothetical protein
MKREPKASEKFRDAMKQILSVSKEEVLRREAEYKKARSLKRKASEKG